MHTATHGLLYIQDVVVLKTSLKCRTQSTSESSQVQVVGSSRLWVSHLRAVIVADTAGLPEHAGSRRGSSLNCGAHGKAYEMKRVDDLGFRETKAKRQESVLSVCVLLSSPRVIKTNYLVYKCVHNMHCYCVKLSLTPACDPLSI